MKSIGKFHMMVRALEESTGHELFPAVMDPEWLMCRLCGKTYEVQYLHRMLPEDLLIEPECVKPEEFNTSCTCGVGKDYLVGHSRWCKLY